MSMPPIFKPLLSCVYCKAVRTLLRSVSADNGIKGMNDSDGKLTETKLVLLLAEDDLSEVLLIRRALERLPMIGQISVVSSGDAAIAYVQGHDQWADRTSYPFPDVLLLDYRMPGLSGLDALCWVRSEPGFERLPVAVLSTDFTDRESQMIDRLNAVRCLKRAGTQEMAEVI